MKPERFERLMENIRQGAACLNGETAPARSNKVTVMVPNVKEVRSRLKVTQKTFAEFLGISLRTLQNWEQCRRVPDRTASVLLTVAADHPEIVRVAARKVLGLP